MTLTLEPTLCFNPVSRSLNVQLNSLKAIPPFEQVFANSAANRFVIISESIINFRSLGINSFNGKRAQLLSDLFCLASPVLSLWFTCALPIPTTLLTSICVYNMRSKNYYNLLAIDHKKKFKKNIWTF